MALKPSDMAARIGTGLLSFPVTHFNSSDQLDAASYRKHVAWLLEHKIGAGGFGEAWLAKHAWNTKEKPRAVKFCTEPQARLKRS